jgi:hypothetical protein
MRIGEMQDGFTTHFQRVETPGEAISDETKDCAHIVS